MFVAVELPENIKEDISHLQEHLKPKVKSAKWVEPSKTHITLFFLGQVENSRLDSVVDALERVKAKRFRVQISGLGWFPRNSRFARVIWTGVSQGAENLKQLSTQVDERLLAIGFKRDKDFSPHITIARAHRSGKIATQPIAETEFSSKEFTVEYFSLMRSQLRPSGPVYTRVKSFLLD